MEPRIVIVTRPTPYQLLLEQHGTVQQARFFLRTRGQNLSDLESVNTSQEQALHTVLAQVPPRWRRVQVSRKDLDRFVFEPEDIVVAVGQDGLIPNVAKYLQGQVVIGINPDPKNYSGTLTRHKPQALSKLLTLTAKAEARTMVEATLDDGQKLLALNEIFVGHQSHQTARYRLGFQGKQERHMSSGLIVCSGTGATGWASSICRQSKYEIALPKPAEDWLSFLVREPFASVVSGTELVYGIISAEQLLEVTSEMDLGGVVFGDGLENDFLNFRWGQKLTLKPAEQKLLLL